MSKFTIKNVANKTLFEGDYTDLAYADLRGADLRGADLRGACLMCANLNSAYLTYADLRSADLTYTNLRRADLRGADLRGADLTYADLTYADLRDTGLLDGGQDQRNYRFVGWQKNGLRIAAGCRDFTIKEARGHWGSPYYLGGRTQGAECLARVELIAALSKSIIEG